MNQGAERHPAQDPVGFVADGGEMGERTCALDGSKTAQAACQAAAATLSQNPHDLPFVLLYLLDGAGGEARLAGWTGLEPGTAASPAAVALTEIDSAWPFRQVIEAGRPVQVHDLSGTFGPLPGGAWPESPQRAVVLPMGKPGQSQLAGFVVAGVSPRLAFTEEYQGYLDLVARHIADAVANARACLEEALGGLPDTAEAVPVMPDALPAAPERVALPYLPAEQDEAGRPRVLVAEDNADMRRYLLRLLTERFRVEAVADGEAALAAARERRPDLILADVMMPGLDGLALLGAVRADPQLRELPVILVSARADEEGRTAGMAAGADDYLVEPFDARELLVRVGTQLQMARLRQDTNEALRRSEERFRQLADAMPQIVWTADGDGRIEYYNRRVDEFDGLRPDADGTWEWQSVLHPDDLEHAAAAWQGALAAGRPCQCEHRARMADGTYRWYLSRAEPAADEHGRAIRWYGTGTDIHDLKLAQEALRRAGEADAFRLALADALRPLVDPAEIQIAAARILGMHLCASRVHYAQVTQDGEYALVRADYCDGVPSVVGRHRFDDYGPTVLAEFRAGRTLVITDVAGDPRLSPAERAATAALGIGAYVMVSLIKQGEPVAVLVVHQTVPRIWTEDEIALIEETAERTWAAAGRAHAEAALRNSEERFRRFADTAPAMLWVTDVDGSSSYLSRGWCAFTGQTLEQALGFGWIDAVHPEDRDSARATFLDANGRRQPFVLEYRLRRSDGEYRWALDAGRPRFDTDGTFLGYIGSVIDIHDRKQTEEALHEADRRKDEFLATLAHELRNPLAPLRNGLAILRLAGQDPQMFDRALGMMERQLEQMVRLIDDLLDVSRISRGKIELRRERVALAPIVHSAIETIRPLMEARGHRLDVHIPLEAIPVDADTIRLAQVFANLLNNAAKYTDPGGHIALTVRRDGEWVSVSVRDDGVGIQSSMLSRIFDLFTQDGSPDRVKSGLGIGLHIVQRLTKMHGGSVEARSAGRGRGSEFVVRLPMAPALDGEAQPEGDSDGREGHSGRHRILIVDDNQDAADSLEAMLSMMGNDTQAAYDGLAALDMAPSFRPDVILLDIGMPRLNGYETAERIRQQPWGRDVFIVAMTGWGQEEDRRRSAAAGFDHHLVKPVDLAALGELLGELA